MSKQQTRNGKPLKVLADGAPRRLADGRNAWRKMNDGQRGEFVAFMIDSLDGNLSTLVDLATCYHKSTD